jgi:ribokinase
MATASIFVLGSFVIACSAKLARFPRAGESLRAERVTIEAGGKGFNFAVGVRRLGIDVSGLLAVGDDLLSAFARPALERAQLPETMLTSFPGRTGSGIGFTDATGENCLAVDSGANLSLGAADVRAVAADVVQAELVLAQFEIGDEPILEAFRLAVAAGKSTLLNPSPFRPITAALLALTSILIVNIAEAAALIESIQPEMPLPDVLNAPDAARLAEAVFATGPDTLIVTRGAAGAIAFRKGQTPLVQKAFAVEPADTLGAGDAFTAGLAASLARKVEFEAALRNAAACGAITTLGLGVFDRLPTGPELEAFLAKQLT